MIDDVFQFVATAAVPAKVTVLIPCAVPKFTPEIVTGVPTTPEVGLRFVMFGVGNTVKLAPSLDAPPTVTVTLPVVADAGTGTTMLASFQLIGVAATVLKATALPP